VIIFSNSDKLIPKRIGDIKKMTNSSYTKRTIEKVQIKSNFLNEYRGVLIYLPPGFNELITYPVIYCQDGKQFFNFGRIATEANRLILDKGIEPMIIVGVEMNRYFRTEEYSPKGSMFSEYTSFFVNELIPYIENNYPIRDSAEHRILAGDSLGGTVSLHLAIDHPKLFKQVISLSGAFFQNTIDRLIHEKNLSWLDIYMIIGLQETDVRTEEGTFDILTQNREVKKILEEKKASIKYLEKDGEHKWGFWQKEIPDALTYFLT